MPGWENMIDVMRVLNLLLPLLMRYGLVVAFGYASLYLWLLAGIDAPGNWSRFYAFAIPVCYALFSTAHLFAQRINGEHQAAFRRWQQYDDASYLLLLGFFGIQVSAPALPAPYFWCAALYLLMVLSKAAFWCGGLLEYIAGLAESPDRGVSLKRCHRLLVFTAIAVYALVSWYHQYRFTTTGDEPHYLLITHSLWQDGDTNLLNNYQQGDYASFYWDKLEPAYGDQVNATTIYSYRHKGIFPHTLLPGYVLGGRFGATLQMNIIAALLMGQVFLLAVELFHSLSAAFMTWLVMAFTIPGIVYMGQIYPETLAALLVVWIARRIRNLPQEHIWRNRQFWRNCGVIAGSLLLLGLLKARYLPLVGSLMLFAVIHIVQRKGRLAQKFVFIAGISVLFALLGVIAVAADQYLLGGMFLARISDSRYMSWFLQGYNPLAGVFGLLFDQEYGLLFYTPLYLLALLGIGLLTRADLAQALPLVMIAGVNHLIIACWPLWHAAPTPPVRYLLPTIPVMGIFMAKFWLLPKTNIKYALAGILMIWSALAAWTMTLNPWWRYNWADGTNNFLEELLSLRLSIDLVRMFPSYMRPTDHIVHTTAAFLFLIGAMIAIYRQEAFHRPSAYAPGAAMAFVFVMTGMLLFGGLLIAKQLPTREIEAEDRLNIGARDGERIPKALDPWDNQLYLRTWRYFGWKLEANQRMTIFPKLARPNVTIKIKARSAIAHKSPDGAPILHLLSKSESLASVKLTSAAWQTYTVPLLMSTLRPELTVIAETANAKDAIIIDKFRFE